MNEPRWRKSSFSGNGDGNCVEVAPLPGGGVGVRDSKHPEQDHFAVSPIAMTAFVASVKAGGFEDVSRA